MIMIQQFQIYDIRQIWWQYLVDDLKSYILYTPDNQKPVPFILSLPYSPNILPPFPSYFAPSPPFSPFSQSI